MTDEQLWRKAINELTTGPVVLNDYEEEIVKMAKRLDLFRDSDRGRTCGELLRVLQNSIKLFKIPMNELKEGVQSSAVVLSVAGFGIEDEMASPTHPLVYKILTSYHAVKMIAEYGGDISQLDQFIIAELNKLANEILAKKGEEDEDR